MELVSYYYLILLIIYFAPAAIANKRDHHSAGLISFVNLITGWTLIGWVGCLIWAYSNTEVTKKTVINKIPSSVANEIKKLAELKEDGLLTEEEFEEQKKLVLGKK